MKKKVIVVLLFFILTMSLSGCSPADPSVQGAMDFLVDIGIPEAQNETIQKSEMYAQVIIDSLKNSRTKDLCNLFCEKIKTSHNIDDEILKAVEFIDGNIINDGELEHLSEAGSAWRDGEKIDSHICPQIKQVETDSGKIYNISFFAYIIYEEDTSYAGITRITIFAEDGTSCMIGEVV